MCRFNVIVLVTAKQNCDIKTTESWVFLLSWTIQQLLVLFLLASVSATISSKTVNTFPFFVRL